MNEELIQQLSLQVQQLSSVVQSIPQLVANALAQRESDSYLANFQRDYSYMTLECTTEYPTMCLNAGETPPQRAPGTLWMYAPRHFILLDMQAIPQIQQEIGNYENLNVDSDTVGGRVIPNRHMYLPDHPFIYLASYADCTHAIASPGIYVMPDYRDDDKDEAMIKETQVAYVLLCNRYNQMQ